MHNVIKKNRCYDSEEFRDQRGRLRGELSLKIKAITVEGQDKEKTEKTEVEVDYAFVFARRELALQHIDYATVIRDACSIANAIFSQTAENHGNSGAI